jgi:hypothetical protein
VAKARKCFIALLMGKERNSPPSSKLNYLHSDSRLENHVPPIFRQHFSKNLIFENEGKLICFCPATSRGIQDALKPNDL